MKRFGQWVNRSIWAVILGLCIYIFIKGLLIFGSNGRLEQAAVRACLPAVTYSGAEEPESWFSVLIKETIPLYAYWKTKDMYLVKEEGDSELIVLEETQIQTENFQKESEDNKETVSAAETESEGRETEAKEKETKGKKKKTKKNKIQKAEEVDVAALQDFEYLLGNYYTVDRSTTVDASQINADALLTPDMSLKGKNTAPQILLYHTHSQEAFADSVPEDVNTTIVGIGNYLTELLEEKYGYQVIHNTSVFDMVDGELDRNTAYTLAAEEIGRILEENPSIEVVIDLHRDGLDGEKMVTDINGKSTAKIMFFNGLSRTARNGDIAYLPNPYVSENLAFSFQLQLKAEEYYPGFTRNIYLQSLRYNLHLRPKALLVEAGSQLNTVEEERNAMEPLADILDMVLKGK